MLDPDLGTNNCSFIIKYIKPEDQGEYAFRVELSGLHSTLFKPKVKISIQDNDCLCLAMYKKVLLFLCAAEMSSRVSLILLFVFSCSQCKNTVISFFLVK